MLADPVILPQPRGKVTRIPHTEPSRDAVLAQGTGREQGKLMAVAEELVLEIAASCQRTSVSTQGLVQQPGGAPEEPVAFGRRWDCLAEGASNRNMDDKALHYVRQRFRFCRKAPQDERVCTRIGPPRMSSVFCDVVLRRGHRALP
jgi:hypothetical protein